MARHARHIGTLAILVWVLVCPALACAGPAGTARMAFVEQFDSAEGWVVTGGAPIKSITAKAGTVRFETVRGALNVNMRRPDWPDWPAKPLASRTTLAKDYDVTVDFDVYRYVVVKLAERGTAVTLNVCGKSTPVCYTTGLRAYDLAHSGLRGRHKLRLAVSLLNSSGVGTFDFVKIVRELTDQEKRVLMPAPVEYFRENRSAHAYHRLEALNARVGRSDLPAGRSQLVAYHDTISNGQVWRLTDQPGDQCFRHGDVVAGFSSDGRYFTIAGGRNDRNVWDFAASRWRATMGGKKLSDKPVPAYAATWESAVHPQVVYGYRVEIRRPKADFVFYRFDRATGVEAEFARFTTDAKWDVRELSRGQGDRVVLGLRGTRNVWIIDPEASPPEKVVRYVELPTRLKGVGLAHNDTKLHWFTCYTFEMLLMDLATGKVSLGYYTSGGHAGGGGGWTLRHYEGMTTIQPDDMFDWRAGDKVKIFAYYASPMRTDYGRLVDNAQWWLANGTAGDVANQHVMVWAEDCATILRLCGYNSSRNSWATNTYSLCSPDATKVAWVSDQLGDGDVHFVVARRPDAPADLKVRKVPPSAVLLWTAPPRRKEIAGYVVYGAGDDNVFRPLHERLIEKTKWAFRPPAGITQVAVAAREWSGLESLPSPAARLDGAKPDVLHLDVRSATRSRTARMVFDGLAWGNRAVRSFRASADEKGPATLTWQADIAAGKVKVFMRCRPDRPAGGQWSWSQLTGGFQLAEGKLAVTVPAAVLVDKVIVAADPNYRPATIDDRFGVPEPVGELQADVSAEGVVTLVWRGADQLDASHVEIFAGADEQFACGNETVIGAVTAGQPQRFVDWDQRPGATVVYKVVSVTAQGAAGRPATVSVRIPPVSQDVCVQAGAAAAKADTGLNMLTIGGEQMLAPKPTTPAAQPDVNSFVPVQFGFDLPVAGRYAIWVRYCPGYTPRLAVPVSIDGGASGDWLLRPPYRPMSTMFGKSAGPVRLYTDRLAAGGKDVFELGKGKHTLTFLLDPAMPDGAVHAIAKIWVTNDPSFRPDGFDPRADFKKRSR